MTLSTNAKEIQRADLLAYAKNLGISIVHIFDTARTYGGMTVAFRKHLPEHTSTNMVEVAVATCSRLDCFSRKEGTRLALYNFAGGRTISLPLSTGFADEDLPSIVKNAFSNIYFT